MGKRSEYVRKERDFYPTPFDAYKPLIDHLPKEQFGFAEPCAGDGTLIKHIENSTNGWCSWASDIEPQTEIVQSSIILTRHFREITITDLHEADYIITNPPWDRKILHDMIDYFTACRPTWLLFDADWKHTKQSIPFLPILKKIVSVGRIKWIPDTKSTGKDNCCWYLFDRKKNSKIHFFGKKG